MLIFTNDVLPAYHGGPCFGMGNFLEGHGDVLRGNRCLVGLRDDDDKSDGDKSDYEVYDSSYETSGTMVTVLSLDGVLEDEPPFVGRLWGGCQDSHVTLVSNEYYTPDGIAMIACNGNDFYNLEDMATKFGLEVNSTSALLPDVQTILNWARSTVMVHQTVSTTQTSMSE